MGQHGDIPECPELTCIRWTAPTGRRLPGVSGCRTCKRGTCSPIATVNKVVSDIETGSGIARTHEYDSLEWRVDGGRSEVGSDRDSSRTMPPAVLRVQY